LISGSVFSSFLATSTFFLGRRRVVFFSVAKSLVKAVASPQGLLPKICSRSSPNITSFSSNILASFSSPKLEKEGYAYIQVLINEFLSY